MGRAPRPDGCAEPHRLALLAEVDKVRRHLAEVGITVEPAPRRRPTGKPGPPGFRSALDELCLAFALTGFERATVALCAAPEVAGDIAAALEAATGSPFPTLGLALRALPDPHWSALTPAAPLRRWRLLRLLDPDSPTRSPAVLDERVLHHLLGAGYLDPEVEALSSPCAVVAELPPPLLRAAADVLAAWEAGLVPVLVGGQLANLRSAAAAAAAAAGLDARAVHLPPGGTSLATVRLLEREAVLGDVAWVFDAGELESPGRVAEGLECRTALLSPAPPRGLPSRAVVVTVEPLTSAHRTTALTSLLALRTANGRTPADAEVAAAAQTFDLPVIDIEQVAVDVAAGADLWESCRTRSHSAFGGLARVVRPTAGWDDLVLPPAQTEQLRTLASGARHRATVVEEWGFGRRAAHGGGVAALFSGPSGTGKTLAAEVLAAELGVDLAVVDLSRLLSKYIGETEKHLDAVFTAAEQAACVLLFDEADALFARRSEVNSANDRYANMESGFLLQRLEGFRGLAILTTNLRESIDTAFLRRLAVVVQFPYPDVAARAALWRKAFPPQVPLDGVDTGALATIDLPGGGIASAARVAAFRGAPNGAVTARDVAAAARWELAKTGRRGP